MSFYMINHFTYIPAESNNDQENSSSDKQNIKLDENGNQVSNPNANAKLDGNNQMNSLESNSSNKSETSHQLATQTNKNTSGNKTNNRRYGSRSFSGKERHMSQRNNSNYSGGGGHHHHQQQQNYSQRNQSNYNKYSSASNASNTVRQLQQQHQPPNYYHSGGMDQQSRQISPPVGYNEANVRSNSAESQNCRVSCFQY